MKIVHIIPVEKFTESFVEFINNNFCSEDHSFLAYGNIEYTTIKKKGVIILTKTVKSLKLLIKSLYNSEKIIIHGLFNYHVILFLFLQPWLLKKCYWVIWGGDLYYYKKEKTHLKSKIYEKIRRYCIKRFNGIINYTYGDYELVKLWYDTKVKRYECFAYPSNLFKEYKTQNKRNSYIKGILVGNSADPSNNHLQILKQLQGFKDENIEIICPLSYGDTNYRDNVISYGKELFGDKFKPMIDFLPFNEYLDILGKIDVAIFAHDRQQALGNIRTLLGLGKKVYIRDDISTWDSSIDINVKVYALNKEKIDFEFSNDIKANNIAMIKKHFSEEKLISDWRKIFES